MSETDVAAISPLSRELLAEGEARGVVIGEAIGIEKGIKHCCEY